MRKQEKQALAIGGGIGLIVFAAVFSTLYKDLMEEFPEGSVVPIDQVEGNKITIDEGEIATIGQNFIATMASYDQEQSQPIKFQSVEELEDRAQAKFEVEQVMGDLSLVYFYTVDIQEGRIIRQNVAVGDRSRRILLANPEPDSIVESNSFTVKGQVFDGQEEVTIKLLTMETNEVVLSRTIGVELEKNAVYSEKIEVSSNIIGEYILEVTDNQSSLRTSVIISQMKR